MSPQREFISTAELNQQLIVEQEAKHSDAGSNAHSQLRKNESYTDLVNARTGGKKGTKKYARAYGRQKSNVVVSKDMRGRRRSSKEQGVQADAG